jgi:hypothetical protein
MQLPSGIGNLLTALTNSPAAQRAWLDVIAARQVFKVVEPRLFFRYTPLQNFNAGFGSDGKVLANHIYAAGCFPETPRVVQRLPIFTKLSPPVFKFIAQPCCLLGIPLGVLRYLERYRRGFRD